MVNSLATLALLTSVHSMEWSEDEQSSSGQAKETSPLQLYNKRA